MSDVNDILKMLGMDKILKNEQAVNRIREYTTVDVDSLCKKGYQFEFNDMEMKGKILNKQHPGFSRVENGIKYEFSILLQLRVQDGACLVVPELWLATRGKIDPEDNRHSLLVKAGKNRYKIEKGNVTVWHVPNEAHFMDYWHHYSVSIPYDNTALIMCQDIVKNASDSMIKFNRLAPTPFSSQEISDLKSLLEDLTQSGVFEQGYFMTQSESSGIEVIHGI